MTGAPSRSSMLAAWKGRPTSGPRASTKSRPSPPCISLPASLRQGPAKSVVFTRRLSITTPPDPEDTLLADVARRRRRMVEMRNAALVRRHGAGQPAFPSEIDGVIALLDSRIGRLDRQSAELAASSPTRASKARMMSAGPGVGLAALAILLGRRPELGAP